MGNYVQQLGIVPHPSLGAGDQVFTPASRFQRAGAEIQKQAAGGQGAQDQQASETSPERVSSIEEVPEVHPSPSSSTAFTSQDLPHRGLSWGDRARCTGSPVFMARTESSALNHTRS